MSERPDKPRISAVIPAYNEGATAPLMHERLTAVLSSLTDDWEVIFVNSGSTDDSTPRVLAGIAAEDDHVTVVNHTRAFGSQSGYTSGMRIATGDVVVLLDGDLQDPPELIPEMLAKWREGYDVVYGERVAREASAFMRRAYKAFYRVFRRLAYVDVPLDAGDFSLMDRRVVDAVNELPESHRFVRGLRAWVGFKQVGVPYTRPDRAFGTSSNNLLRNIGWARRAIISFSYTPLDLMMGLGLLVTAAAFVAAIVEIVLRIVNPDAFPGGFATLIVVVLFIGGIQLLCISVIGSYIAHMYEEVKRRPPYIVESVINPPRPREDGPQPAETPAPRAVVAPEAAARGTPGGPSEADRPQPVSPS